MPNEAFFILYSGLPRQGPGSERSTLQALRRLPGLPPNPRVLDLGCGTGRQTLVLARTLGGRITAVDTYAPYLEELTKAGFAEVIETRELSMDALDYPEPSSHPIWPETAVYILGAPRALQPWRPF
ncbi:MAG: class I SAM-dependent methyltransferase, partial [bacterium]|nr:class I SAM-dependent methyltransferase [bacterium]